MTLHHPLLRALMLTIAMGAGQAVAATATLYTAGWNAVPRATPLFQQPDPGNFLSSPGGAVQIGGYLWYGEEFWGGRLDPDPAGAMLPQPHRDYTYFFAGNASKVGQMAIDRARQVFYWSNPQKANALGVVAVFYDPATSRSDRSCWFALGVAAQQPTALAVAPDGRLYAGFAGSGSIVRFDTRDLRATCPAAPASFPVAAEPVGASIRGNGVSGLAFIGNDLYVAGKDGLGVIRDAAACTGRCNAAVVAGSVAGSNHVGLAADGADLVYYLRDNAVWRHRVSTGLHERLAGSGTLPDGNVAGFAFVNGQTNLIALDEFDTLWIGDDVSNGASTYSGRIWRLATASTQVGTPVAPPPPAAAGSSLEVKTAGGKGLVVGSPGGIQCGAVCKVALDANSLVTLSATADAGFRFIGWSGACAGAAPTCSVVVNGRTQVQANFTK